MKCWICGEELRDRERTVAIDLGEHRSSGDTFYFKARLLEVHLHCLDKADPVRFMESIRGRLREGAKRALGGFL